MLSTDRLIPKITQTFFHRDERRWCNIWNLILAFEIFIDRLNRRAQINSRTWMGSDRLSSSVIDEFETRCGHPTSYRSSSCLTWGICFTKARVFLASLTRKSTAELRLHIDCLISLDFTIQWFDQGVPLPPHFESLEWSSKSRESLTMSLQIFAWSHEIALRTSLTARLRNST